MKFIPIFIFLSILFGFFTSLKVFLKVEKFLILKFENFPFWKLKIRRFGTQKFVIWAGTIRSNAEPILPNFRLRTVILEKTEKFQSFCSFHTRSVKRKIADVPLIEISGPIRLQKAKRKHQSFVLKNFVISQSHETLFVEWFRPEKRNFIVKFQNVIHEFSRFRRIFHNKSPRIHQHHWIVLSAVPATRPQF